ncbi:MAG TPA: LysR family transcriptional regulator [Steroidobacteraceae bacterium]
MIRQRVPPLSWLRVFEAAARYESFVAAARELSLSRTAVSRTIKQLEQYLEIDLFVRNARGVQLTQIGRDYASAIRPALEDIVRASAHILKHMSADTRLFAQAKLDQANPSAR